MLELIQVSLGTFGIGFLFGAVFAFLNVALYFSYKAVKEMSKFQKENAKDYDTEY